MIRRPPRSTLSSSSAASDVYKRQYQRRVRGSCELVHGMTATLRLLGALVALVAVHCHHLQCHPSHWGGRHFGSHQAQCDRCTVCPEESAHCGGFSNTPFSELMDLTQRRAATKDSFAVVALLYLPGCPFSAAAWPELSKAIARFPQIEALAVDVTMQHRYLADQSVVGVPALLLFVPGGVYKYTLDQEQESDKIAQFLQRWTSCEPLDTSSAAAAVHEDALVWQGPSGDGGSEGG
eukprot:TRINITY_DN1787_c0_g1_i2.p1 TRINITY_DN1787_c0_g1~~TRINITY_DN1787_c0_g1_i2.p1  ORF type:complete len:236 (+),score=42.84 TRINITY_DN1787_c0_g1_i2:61-768(+)